MEYLFELNKYSTKIPTPRSCHPELYTSNFLNDEGVIIYQSYMGNFLLVGWVRNNRNNLCNSSYVTIPVTNQWTAYYIADTSVLLTVIHQHRISFWSYSDRFKSQVFLKVMLVKCLWGGLKNIHQICLNLEEKMWASMFLLIPYIW